MGREKAKISELSPKELDKYEYYVTGEDLECKPWVVGQAKFEYHSLHKNTGLEKEDKKGGYLKRL